MPDGAKKGITVKVSAELHAEVSAYIREHGMTMSEFVAGALENELHPKISEKEGNNMANTRTVAFQVPEELFQRIKDYLQRNHMTQKQFLLGLIERELDRDQVARENAVFEYESEQDEDEPDYSENGTVDDFEGDSDEDEFEDESEDEYDEEDPASDDEEYEDKESEDEDFDDDESEDEDFDDDEAEDEDFGMSM